MATVNDFSKLAVYFGVDGYLLVRRDGSVVSSNINEAVALASTIVMSGINCEAMEGCLGSKRHSYIVIERECQQHLLIFFLGNYFLGILKKQHVESGSFISSIIVFLKTLTTKGKNHAGIF